jgi:hypothetical protein
MGLLSTRKAYHPVSARSATITIMRPATLLLLAAFPLGALVAEPAKPALTIESVKVEPAAPRAETLCHLTITLRNAGAQLASGLEFMVKVNGKALPAYDKRLYLVAVEPGATRELHLFNFWSTEAGRPAPASGRLDVEVTLAHASWARRTTRDGAEVLAPAGDVPGLPVGKSLSVIMTK